MEKNNYIKEAKALLKRGISVIPVRTDGSKLPKIYWKEFQNRCMTEAEAEEHFEECGGVIAITGRISQLFCMDFDLDKQRETDDFWTDFKKEVPKELLKKMLVNQTRSGGYHIWIRTNYEDKSRKVALRPLTIPELQVRYEKAISKGADPIKTSEMLMRKPVECVIETRSRGSYGVFAHPQYTREFGTKIQTFTEEEVELLLNVAYSLSCGYKRPTVYKGKANAYKIIAKFTEDVTADEILGFVESTGLFAYHDTDGNGNYRLSRTGSESMFSAYIYKDSGVLHIFGLNPLSDENKETLGVFETYCLTHGFSEEEAVEELKKKYEK